jgi:ABC-type polar amino acid transport system ATPase subunit
VLPISEHEDEIVAAVDANPVVVVIGETGSGKSTQLSQILHRRGYTRRGAIAVTQPRRVAAVSVSRFFVSLSFLLYHMREALFFSVGRSWAVRRDWDWNCLYIL